MPKQHLPRALDLAGGDVVTRQQLMADGVDDDLGDRLHRAGLARRLAPSTYLLAAEKPTDEQLLAAALLHAGADCVVTGLLACAALGVVDVPPASQVEVLVPARRRRVSSAYIRVQPTRRPPSYWEKDEVRYAAAPRAVVDAGRRLTSLRDVRALVTAAVRGGFCTADDLLAELDAGSSGGSALCRRAVRDAAAGARSAPEAEVADVAARAARAGRLPPYLLNPTLLLDGVVIGEPDGWLVGLGVGWEVDSRRHHGEDDDFDATLARHDRFVGHGLALLHVTPKRARQMGDAYADVLAEAAAGRRALSRPEPPGLVVRPRGPLQPPPGRLPRA